MDDTAAPAGAPAPAYFPAAGEPNAPVVGDEPTAPLPPPVEREAERLAELLARLHSAGPATDPH